MLINNKFNEETILSPSQYVWHLFKKKTTAMAAVWMGTILLIILFFAQYLMPHDPEAQTLSKILLPPYWLNGGDSSHVLGTDELGRDTFSRILQGIQITLGSALIVTLIIIGIGLFFGSLSASFRGLKASFLQHFLDSILVIPTLLLALIIVVILGTSFENCLYAIALSLLPQVIQGVHSAINTEMSKVHITALRLDGASNLQVLRYGIYPNISEPMVTLINHIFSMVVLEVTTLGFLGFGMQTNSLELGSLIASNFDLIYLSPTLIVAPGAAVFFIVFTFNVLAEGIRHAIIEGDE
jgi:cationic peptide transport system permease protein